MKKFILITCTENFSPDLSDSQKRKIITQQITLIKQILKAWENLDMNKILFFHNRYPEFVESILQKISYTDWEDSEEKSKKPDIILQHKFIKSNTMDTRLVVKIGKDGNVIQTYFTQLPEN